jgi:hypothetical protein
MLKRARHRIQVAVAAVIAAAAALHTQAQTVKLREPTRTVYKCEVGGKIAYSDEPCLGATRMEIQPTRGLDSSTGTRKIGSDVQREHNREAFADAVKPLTGMDARQLDIAGRRGKLKPEIQRECARLDASIHALERQEAGETGDRKPVQQQLYQARARYRQASC